MGTENIKGFLVMALSQPNGAAVGSFEVVTRPDGITLSQDRCEGVRYLTHMIHNTLLI